MSDEIKNVLSLLKIEVKSKFIPFSQSRNKDTKNTNLNWIVTITAAGRDILETDFSSGIAHCPGYKAEKAPPCFIPRNYRNVKGQHRMATPREALNQWRDYLAKAECESGHALRPMGSFAAKHAPELVPDREHVDGKSVRREIEPNPLDVIYCLMSDCSVLDYCGFTDWAESYGYSDDSISAKAIYDSCVAIALQVRNGLGDDALKALQEAFQDY